MRIECPDCFTEYEIPDDVIPETGREMQCSDCDHTWFQPHPDFPESAVPPEAPRSKLAPEVVNVLREEAQRETRARAAESGETGRGRKARIRGRGARPESLTPSPEEAPAAELEEDIDLTGLQAPEPTPQESEAQPRNRRSRPPANAPIAEVIPTEAVESAPEPARMAAGMIMPPQAPERKSGGLGSFFLLLLMIGALMAGVYVMAPQLKEAVPEAAGPLDSFTGVVDQGLAWVKAQDIPGLVGAGGGAEDATLPPAEPSAQPGQDTTQSN